MPKQLSQSVVNFFLEKLQSECKTNNVIAEYQRNLASLQKIVKENNDILDREVLEKWKQSQKELGLSHGTVDNRVVQMNRFLRYIGCAELCFPVGGRLDLTGQQFGNLIVLEPTEQKSRDRSVCWKCRCLSCGKEKMIPANQLMKGSHISCGCERRKRII